MRSYGRHVRTSLVTALLLSGLLPAAEAEGPTRPPTERPIGWLGISIQEVGEELAERLAAAFGVESGTGVLVVEAIRDGPAEAAGLQPNDVIEKLDNQPIWEVRQLQEIIRDSAPGRPLRLTLLRGRERVRVSVTVGQMPEAFRAQLAGERLGFLARSRSGNARAKDVAGTTEEEVRVVLVEPGSPAAEAGLKPQDLLVRIGEHDVRSLEEMAKALRAGKPGERLSIQVVRDGERHSFLLPIPSSDDMAGSR